MPFAGGIDSLSNGTLLLSAAAAFFYLLMQGRPPSWRRTVAKTASVGLLAVLAIIEGGPAMLAAALFLGAAGDAFLAQEGERFFLAGLASFLLAHLAYLMLFAETGGGVEILLAQPWRAILPLIALAASALLLTRLIKAAAPGLRMPVAVYVLAIAAMMLASATVGAPIVMLGAFLFVVSDAILAIEKFLMPSGSPHRRWSGPAVWTLYWAAQAAITLGFLL
jgi:uncharacterized membrane protein YhhN